MNSYNIERTNLKVNVLTQLARSLKDENINRFFPQRNAGKSVSPEGIRAVPQLTAKCSAPMG
jgi:hypothetical protein